MKKVKLFALLSLSSLCFSSCFLMEAWYIVCIQNNTTDTIYCDRIDEADCTDNNLYSLGCRTTIPPNKEGDIFWCMIHGYPRYTYYDYVFKILKVDTIV